MALCGNCRNLFLSLLADLSYGLLALIQQLFSSGMSNPEVPPFGNSLAALYTEYTESADSSANCHALIFLYSLAIWSFRLKSEV